MKKTLTLIAIFMPLLMMAQEATGIVTLRGRNGRDVTLTIISVQSTGINAIPAGNISPQLIKWELIDIDYMKKNYPSIEAKRLSAVDTEKNQVFSNSSTALNAQTIDDVKKSLKHALESVKIYKITEAMDRANKSKSRIIIINISSGQPSINGVDWVALSADPANHIKALDMLRFDLKYERKGTVNLIAAITSARTQLANLPETPETKTYDTRVLIPSLKMLQDIMTNPGMDSSAWAGICDQLIKDIR